MALNPDGMGIRGSIRLLTIVDSAEHVGLVPMTARLIHVAAYLTNALSPVWNLAPYTTEVLKLAGGPYDPGLQQELDRLVGRGILIVHEPSYEYTEDDGWRLAAEYKLHHEFSRPILDGAMRYPDEAEASRVVREICLALAAAPTDELEGLVRSDVSYANPAVSPKSVVDLFGVDGNNPSSRTAQRFGTISPRGVATTPAEEAHLYIRHMLRIGASGVTDERR